jgi:hypothetical protein
MIGNLITNVASVPAAIGPQQPGESDGRLPG